MHYSAGGAVGDYDNDGDVDLFITSHGYNGVPGPGQHRLYRNEGDHFVDVAAAAGVNLTSPVVGDGFGATFGDYDLDGDLDLFVTGWKFFPDPGYGNRLFRNEGDGTFTDVTSDVGINVVYMSGFSPTFADMDGDLYPELLIAADFGSSRYFRNEGGRGRSRTRPTTRGPAWRPTAWARPWPTGTTTGCSTGTSARSGSRTPASATCCTSTRATTCFEEVSRQAGVNDGGWGWGSVGVDFDHDGWVDLVETNGWGNGIWDNVDTRVWWNRHDGTFQDVATTSGFHHDYSGRGLLNLDYDNDGDQDFVVSSVNLYELKLYRKRHLGARDPLAAAVSSTPPGPPGWPPTASARGSWPAPGTRSCGATWTTGPTT